MGAISHAREENKPVFKWLWMVIFFLGFVLTNHQLLELMSKILQYEVNTSVNVEKRSFLDFPSVTVCNNNLIHCQYLFDMILDCEKKLSGCPKKELYCNIYVTGNCSITPVIGGDGYSVCSGHNVEITVLNTTTLVDFKIVRLKQFQFWYAQLTTDEMKKLAHHPQDFIAGCTFGLINTTLCYHFKRFGGTRIFSATKGVCYSLNLEKYFPEDLKESLKKSSRENILQSDEMTEREIFYPGPMLSLELVLNIEGTSKCIALHICAFTIEIFLTCS